MRSSLLLFLLMILFISCDKTLTTSPPDPEPPEGSFTISTQPEGYDIYLDGRISGFKTPAEFKYMAEKQYSVTLKHAWYLDSLTELNFQGGDESFFLNIENDPAFTGNIVCRSYPWGAFIILDDSMTGKITPNVLHNLYPGKHTVRYELVGHRSSEKEVIVLSNDSTTFSTSLQDTTIWLTFNTRNSLIPSQDLTSIAVENTYYGDKLWVGTTDNGFFSMINYQWFSVNSENTSMPKKFISKILVDKNKNKWAASIYRIYKYSDNGNFTVWDDQPYNDFTIENYTGSYWFTLEEKGILKRNSNGDVFYTKENSPLLDDNVLCIDNSGTYIAVGTKNGGFVVINSDEEGDSWYVFDNSYMSEIGWGPGTIRTIKVQNTGLNTKVYAAVNNVGVYIVNDIETREGEFVQIPAVINSISVQYVLNILWIGTTDGLYKIKGTEVLEHYTVSNSPLESNFITDVKLGDPIWIATAKGLVRYKGN
jgi:hypothetical protein